MQSDRVLGRKQSGGFRRKNEPVADVTEMTSSKQNGAVAERIRNHTSRGATSPLTSSPPQLPTCPPPNTNTSPTRGVSSSGSAHFHAKQADQRAIATPKSWPTSPVHASTASASKLMTSSHNGVKTPTEPTNSNNAAPPVLPKKTYPRSSSQEHPHPVSPPLSPRMHATHALIASQTFSDVTAGDISSTPPQPVPPN